MLTLITLLKCNSYLFLLSRIKVILSRRNRMLLYNSYILPHLDLCCIIWGNCSSTLKDKLVKFQKRSARVILYCDFYTPSSELFKELNWQIFLERVTYQKALLMYRIINNICPYYLNKYVSNTSDVSCRDTRSTYCNKLYTPKVLHVLWSFHLEFSPLHVKNVTSVTTFKSLYLKWERLNGH